MSNHLPSWWDLVKDNPALGLFSDTKYYWTRVGFTEDYEKSGMRYPTLWHMNKLLEQQGFEPLLDLNESTIMDESAGAAAYFQCNNDFRRMIEDLLPDKAIVEDAHDKR